jgi:hypothetical protein
MYEIASRSVLRLAPICCVALLVACAPEPAPFVPVDSDYDGGTRDSGVEAPTEDDLTTWTLHDVVTDAAGRVGRAGVVVTSASGGGVREDGTIDLREPAPGAEHPDGWSLRLASPGTSESWFVRYEPYDTGARWPSIEPTPYVDFPPFDILALPDSPAIISAAACSGGALAGADLELRHAEEGAVHAHVSVASDSAVLAIDGPTIEIVEACGL